jgi:tetratricopeptide (TPR) repeat protein
MKTKVLIIFLLVFLFHPEMTVGQISKKDSILSVVKYNPNAKKSALYHDISKLEKEPDSIRKYALMSLKYAKSENQKGQMGDAYKSIGASYHLASSFSNALAYYDSALMYFNPNTQTLQIAKTYSNKAGIYTTIRSLDSAIYFTEKSYESAKSLNDKNFEKLYLKRKADIYNLQGKYEKSIEIQKESIRNIGSDTSTLLNTYNEIGLNYYHFGNVDSALYYYHLVLLSNTNLNPELKIIVQNNIANVYLHKGEYELAIKSFIIGIRTADSIRDFVRSSALKSNLANLYFSWEKYEEAINIYKEGLKFQLENNSLYHLSIFYTNIGISYNALKQSDSALKYHELAKDVCITSGDNVMLCNVYNNLGSVYVSKNEFQTAIKYFRLALDSTKNNEKVTFKANIFHSLGSSLAEVGDFKNALNYIDSAKNLYLNTKNISQLVNVNYSKAVILKKMGRYEEAFEQLDDYIDLKDSVFSEEKFKQISELETKYKTAEKEAEIQKQKVEIAENKLEINKQKNKALSYGLLFNGAAIIALILLIIFLRNKQKHQLIKSKLEHLSNEQEGRLLRSQMNPHFIFNSLNSIQSYVTSNDSYHAEIYLSKFAKLMRSILENSRHAFVSFDQDLNNLMIYLELEELRFEGKFSQQIEIDEKIDLENTYIPPMLIQPYIENAIIHGLVNKIDNDGKLLLKFELESEEAIKCTIEDNGIGREKALDLKSRGVKPYKSLGMQVTKERMEVISKINKVHFEEKITDLKDPNGTSIGTKVELIIPIEKD